MKSMNMKSKWKLCLTLFCIWISICILAMTSCNSRQNSVSEDRIIKVDLDQKDGPVPGIQIEKIIPLEMTDNSLLSNVYSLNVKHYDGRYYILDVVDGQCLYVFGEDGSFLNKTLNGRGPGEFINPFAFAIDHNEKTIKLWDQTLSTMFSLDPDLNILSSEKWDTIRIVDFRILDKNRMLVYHDIRTDNIIESSQNQEIFQYTLYENDFSKATILDLSVYAKNPVSLPAPFYTGDETLLILPRDHIVYRMLDQGKIEPAYQYDFGKYMYTEGESKRLSDQEKEALEYSGKKIRGLGMIQKNKAFLLSLLAFNNQPITLAYSLKSGITYNLNDCVEKHLLPAGFPQCAIGKSSFLALVDPMSMKAFVEESASEEFSGLEVSENDNPYLMIYSISE